MEESESIAEGLKEGKPLRRYTRRLLQAIFRGYSSKKWLTAAFGALSLFLLFLALYPQNRLEKKRVGFEIVPRGPSEEAVYDKVDGMLSALAAKSSYLLTVNQYGDHTGISIFLEEASFNELHSSLKEHLATLFCFDPKLSFSISSFKKAEAKAPLFSAPKNGERSDNSLWLFSIFVLVLFFFLGWFIFQKEPKNPSKKLPLSLRKKIVTEAKLRIDKDVN